MIPSREHERIVLASNDLSCDQAIVRPLIRKEAREHGQRVPAMAKCQTQERGREQGAGSQLEMRRPEEPEFSGNPIGPAKLASRSTFTR